MTSVQTTSTASGIQNPAVLDQITQDSATGRVTLLMVETRPWNGGEKQLFELQEKINSYLSFILDGEMAEVYPGFIGKPVALQLDCPDYPNDPVIDFLEKIHRQLEKLGFAFTLRVREKVAKSSSDPEGSCGSTSCQCHSH